jgi:glycosyltransferase involved in cell wall biosynthesis
MQKELINEQILCIGFPAWEGEYLKSTVQLASELAKHNRVLYVEYPFTWKDVAMGKLGKSKAPWHRILGKEERLRTMRLENGASIEVLTLPPSLPVNFIDNEHLYDALMSVNARKAYRCIRQAMDVLGFHRPVVINAFNPFLGVFLARQFDEKALIYYCYDEIGAAKWAGKHGARLEYLLMREADAVVTSSEPLYRSKLQSARRSFLVKNGVDFDLFNRRQHAGHSAKPASVSDLPMPAAGCIGYLGSLDERVDFDLLKEVITALPHRQFVFVGRVMEHGKAEQLRRFPNVKIMGSQPPSSLPAWVGQFGVCMIPFLKNELTAGIYPLKINEYFAAGKPVVTTDFGDLADFRHLVQVAETPAGFAAALERALANNTPGDESNRIGFARNNSWAQRAAEMGYAIGEVMRMSHLAAKEEERTWMPDNYNRWGRASAAFFSEKKPKLEGEVLPVEGFLPVFH